MSRSRHVRPADGDRGSVTAELAMALPTLLVVLVVGLYALSAVSLQGRCADAARSAARALARGDDETATRTQLLAALPAGSAVTVERGSSDPALVAVTVRMPLSAPGGIGLVLAGRAVSARATAAEEGR